MSGVALHRLPDAQLLAIAGNDNHPDQARAEEELDARAEDASFREFMGVHHPEDTPRLDDPWWKHP